MATAMAQPHAKSKMGGARFPQDPSLLKQPIQLGMTGLKQLLQCYQVGTEEIKERLMNDCDYIMECKVCRSLYRGLPNFLSHKRFHCQNHFPGSMIRFQDLSTKEDETNFAGTAFRPTVEVLSPSSQSPKKPAATPSQLATFYKNIELVGKTINSTKSTDKTICLDTLPNTQAAVAQSLATGGSPKSIQLYLTNPKVLGKAAIQPEVRLSSLNLGKKRKADGSDQGPSSKKMHVQPQIDKSFKPILGGHGYKSESYPGLFKELNDFYLYTKLFDPITMKCTMCDEHGIAYKSIITARSHIDNYHLKVRNFIQCEKCPLLFKVNRPSQFKKHLNTVHGISMDETTDICENAPKFKKYFAHERVLDIPGFDYSTSRNLLYVSSGQAKLDNIENVKVNKRSGRSLDDSRQKEECNEDPPDDDDVVVIKQEEATCVAAEDGKKRDNRLSSAVISSLGIADLNSITCKKHPNVMFQGIKLLKAHVMMEHVKDVYHCPLCPEKFSAKKLIAPLCSHLRKQHEITEDLVPSIVDKLRASMIKESEDDAVKPVQKGVINYHCTKCEKSYFAITAVLQHMKAVHGITDEEWASLKESVEENVTLWTPATTRRQQSMVTGEPSASIFNLDDIKCPFCPYYSCSLCLVVAHTKLKHGLNDEEAKKLKMKLKEKEKIDKARRAKLIQAISPKKRIRSANRPVQNKPVKPRRKQVSPLKSPNSDEVENSPLNQQDGVKDSNGNTQKHSGNPLTLGNTQKSGSPSKNIIPTKSFKMHQCDHCRKVFGNQQFLLKHQRIFCRRGSFKEKSSENEVKTEPESDDKSGDGSLGSTPEKGGPFCCWKCSKDFSRVQSMMIHTKYCQATGPKTATGSQDSESSDESVPLIYMKKPGSNKLHQVKVSAGNGCPRASSD